MICPICSAALPEGARRCPGCGAELEEYLNAAYQPDLLFNEALDKLEREQYTEACSLLCRAHALRPEDAGILALWVRGEYSAGNKRRAVELMTHLLELDDSPERQAELDALVEEYDREPATPAPAPSAAPAVPESAASNPSGEKKSGFFSGGMPDFSQLASMFPGMK